MCVILEYNREEPHSVSPGGDFMRFLKKYILVYTLLLALFAGGAEYLAERPVQAQTAVNTLPQGEPTVVIDPGHGGEDGGAVSASGIKESNINLQISLRMDDLLRFLGIPTIMTRKEDVSIYDASAVTVSEKKVSDLKNRAAIVNSKPNTVLISIHQNMFSDGKYSGAQVFYAPTEHSEELADSLQASLRDHLDPSNHREAKKCDAVWLMEHISCVGVLVECGFLSNAEETQKLMTDDYQKKLTCVIVSQITQYLPKETVQNEI